MTRWRLYLLAISTVFVCRLSQGEVPRLPPGGTVPPESITGPAAITAPGHETPVRDPFRPYDLGPSSATWPNSRLSPGERQAVKNGRDSGRWAAIQAGYAHAGREQAQHADAARAAFRLGVPDLSRLGVVP